MAEVERVQREQVRFRSGADECAAWFYPGSNGGCVVMAGGFAVPKEPGTDLFAGRFHEAGFSVLAFDYRGLGGSGGTPHLVLPVRDQLADWDAALAFASGLRGVDPGKLAVWGFSASAGHVLRVATDHPELAGAIAQTPLVDGPTATLLAAKHQRPGAMARFTAMGILDGLAGLVGREPILLPLAGEPGVPAMITSPDGRDAERALDPDGRHVHWRRAAAARSSLALGFYRPGRAAGRVRSPLLVLVCDDDQVTPVGSALRAAARAPRGELFRIPGGHYEPFLDGHDRAVEAQLSFLTRHLLIDGQP
ncbi:alpha/beta hydrolase [Pseudonocardia spinosispora]|uniref:alpha/beta hydrolase n=1 Tax=Pseudonocardia spinosispora TaxID=103441 RepID=UPI000419B59B|nr:alpha/beta hydrolase [Pseudonocardia spinosispora]